MYNKDKSQRITLRLTEKQFAFVKANADIMGVSPSEFLRIVINTAMSAQHKVELTAKLRKDGIGRENDETSFNDQFQFSSVPSDEA